MKILHTECFAVEMPLKEPYTIAYETLSSCTNLFIRATTDAGVTGFGCAAPDEGVTGETPGMTLDVYNSIIEPGLKGADFSRVIRILEELKPGLTQNPSALAMTDMLLYDLISKKAGLPLYRFLGGFRKSIPTSITIGIMTASETIEKARDYFRQGFRILKVKGGVSVEEDIEKVALLRKTFGHDITMRFDANQGYSVADAISFVHATRNQGVELLEQPTPKDNYEMLGKVSNSVSMPVMADESLMNLRDVFSLTRDDLTDMINIKLMKVGGITEALHINSVARAAGVESMVGCMDESALAISAGLHFALARPNIFYADLDGHLDLINDPAKGAVILKAGILYPNESPGMGVNTIS